MDISMHYAIMNKLKSHPTTGLQQAVYKPSHNTHTIHLFTCESNMENYQEELSDAAMQQVMENMNRGDGTWDLSPFKMARRNPNGEIIIAKKKPDGSGGYWITIHPTAVAGIHEKKQEILDVMVGVKSGVFPNPTNVEVACPADKIPRIVQLSLFNKNEKFGIHMLDGYNLIMVSKGLNLSTDEFKQLCVIIGYFKKNAKIGTTFPVARFAWTWVPQEPVCNTVAPPITNGRSYVALNQCIEEAEESKPIGDYVPVFSVSTQHYTINADFVDSVVASLILNNIEEIKTELVMSNRLMMSDSELEEDFAPQAAKAITFSQVLDVCGKVVNISEKVSAAKMVSLMGEILKRGINLEAYHSLQNGTLKKDYVDLLHEIM